jgi:two-component sensor histidine kinase
VGGFGGLGRADDPTDDRPHFMAYTTEQGLSSNQVFGITEDRWGRIYVATGAGVDRLTPQATGLATAIEHFTSAEGLAAGETKAVFRDHGGDLWFASGVGLSQLRPVPPRSASPPPILVTGVQIGSELVPVPETGETAFKGPSLRPGQGPLRIDFVGLSFAPGEALRYQYRVDGLDRDWSPTTDQRSVVYGRLPSGKYQFQVRAINSFGTVSPNPANMSFTMLPPVWLSWWFLSLASIGTGALIYVAHRYRVRQLLAVERVRTRIATDLHDDIGSSLSQISILSKLVHQRINTTDPEVSEPLAEIATVSGEVVASLSDIVWAINPRHDRLSDLSARMRRFAFDTVGARGIDLGFHVNDQHQYLRTNSDFRRQVYLIFKEAINNATRHAGCSRVTIELSVGSGRLELRMSDDGSGFEPQSPNDGNGLTNMRRRAADLGGKLDLRSEPGHGTEVTLIVPLPDSRTP